MTDHGGASSRKTTPREHTNSSRSQGVFSERVFRPIKSAHAWEQNPILQKHNIGPMTWPYNNYTVLSAMNIAHSFQYLQSLHDLNHYLHLCLIPYLLLSFSICWVLASSLVVHVFLWLLVLLIFHQFLLSFCMLQLFWSLSTSCVHCDKVVCFS